MRQNGGSYPHVPAWSLSAGRGGLHNLPNALAGQAVLAGDLGQAFLASRPDDRPVSFLKGQRALE